jgi:hypothetical protein
MNSDRDTSTDYLDRQPEKIIEIYFQTVQEDEEVLKGLMNAELGPE